MKLAALILAVFFLALPAAAQTVVGVEIYRADDTFMSDMQKAMEKAAEGRVILEVTDGQKNQTIQNGLIAEHIAQGVSVLAVNLVDPTASPLILEKARASGIPVVFFNCEPDAADMPDSGWYYVGARAEESGIMQGELMADYFRRNPGADLDGDGIIRYVQLTGQASHQDAALRSEYCVKAFKNAGFKVSLVDSECADWQGSVARDIMWEWLASYDSIEAVFSNDDDMAIGAIDALKAAGYFSGGENHAGGRRRRDGACIGGAARGDAARYGVQ